MDYNINELRIKIDGYFNGTVTKNELGSWASFRYYDLLTGGSIECDKIILYPFLKMVSEFHIEEDDAKDIFPTSESEIKKIQNILHGNENFEFQFEMGIPEHLYKPGLNKENFNLQKRELFIELKAALEDYFNKEESQNLYLKINELFNQPGQTNTILDMLEERIVKIIKAIFEITDDDIQLKRRIRLYGNKSEHRNIVDKLMEYLDYYLGEKMFNVLVFYENGVPDLEIL